MSFFTSCRLTHSIYLLSLDPLSTVPCSLLHAAHAAQIHPDISYASEKVSSQANFLPSGEKFGCSVGPCFPDVNFFRSRSP
ncbi:hypothetical protein OF83DRAFT_1146843 [Amylostereum chailletii]|nr:hypothetical protein OF83DRAFT_1146843 [Amylostereum chailletii]